MIGDSIAGLSDEHVFTQDVSGEEHFGSEQRQGSWSRVTKGGGTPWRPCGSWGLNNWSVSFLLLLIRSPWIRPSCPGTSCRLRLRDCRLVRPAMAGVQGANIATELPPCKLPLNKVMSCSLRRCYSTSYNYMLVHLSLVVRPASH